MIKQSVLNKFDKKYVKANIGDEPVTPGSLMDSEGLGPAEPKTVLNADEKLFDSLNKLFLSSLNLNEPGMNYGALKVIAKSPFSYAPMLKILGVKRDAQEAFLKGKTDMTAYFMEMKRIFDEDIKVESPEGRDEFITWFLDIAKSDPGLVGTANRPMAQVLWNKLLKLYTQFIRLAIEGLGGSTAGMSTRPDQSKSWKAGTVGPQITQLWQQLGSPFSDYISDFGRDYVFNLLDSVDHALTDWLAAQARFYSSQKEEGTNYREKALEKIKSSPNFTQISDLLKSEMISFRVALEASRLETQERAALREKTETSGVSTDGHDKLFWTYLEHDVELEYQIQQKLGTGHNGGAGRRDSVVIFLRALKQADPELFMKFSTGTRGAIRAPEGTEKDDRESVIDKQVTAFKETDIYKRAVDAAMSVITRSRANKPGVDLSVGLDTNDAQRKETLIKLDNVIKKRTALIAKMKTLSKTESVEKAKSMLRGMDEDIQKIKELAKKFGATE